MCLNAAEYKDITYYFGIYQTDMKFNPACFGSKLFVVWLFELEFHLKYKCRNVDNNVLCNWRKKQHSFSLMLKKKIGTPPRLTSFAHICLSYHKLNSEMLRMAHTTSKNWNLCELICKNRVDDRNSRQNKLTDVVILISKLSDWAGRDELSIHLTPRIRNIFS